MSKLKKIPVMQVMSQCLLPTGKRCSLGKKILRPADGVKKWTFANAKNIAAQVKGEVKSQGQWSRGSRGHATCDGLQAGASLGRCSGSACEWQRRIRTRQREELASDRQQRMPPAS